MKTEHEEFEADYAMKSERAQREWHVEVDSWSRGRHVIPLSARFGRKYPRAKRVPPVDRAPVDLAPDTRSG